MAERVVEDRAAVQVPEGAIKMAGKIQPLSMSSIVLSTNTALPGIVVSPDP